MNSLSLEHSNNLKGLLIILIVFGHIKFLITPTFQYLLYSFHITSFLFLPFLFNQDKLTIHNFVKIMRRYYIPYIIFFIISLIAYNIFFQNNLTIINTFLSFFIATGPKLREVIGISAYWFFPALIFTLILIMSYNSLNEKYLKYLFLIIFVLIHLFIGELALPNQILKYFPFSLYIGGYIFIIGIIFNYIFKNLAWNKIHLSMYFILFVVLSIILYGQKFNLASPYLYSFINNPVYFILQDLYMIISLLFLIKLTKKLTYLKIFGIYAISIYTLHPLVIALVDKLYKFNNFELSLVKFFIVLLITYILSFMIYKFKINNIVYPK